MKKPYKKPAAEWMSFQVSDHLMDDHDTGITIPTYSMGIAPWPSTSPDNGVSSTTYNDNGTITR